MRDSYVKFQSHGIKLYAVSYDDQETLREFAREQNIPYPLLSDIDSDVIRRLVVCFELAEGLHIYGEPVPEGMVATRVTVTGPPGLTALKKLEMTAACESSAIRFWQTGRRF